jgi:hypothetical protein
MYYTWFEVRLKVRLTVVFIADKHAPDFRCHEDGRQRQRSATCHNGQRQATPETDLTADFFALTNTFTVLRGIERTGATSSDAGSGASGQSTTTSHVI